MASFFAFVGDGKLYELLAAGAVGAPEMLAAVPVPTLVPVGLRTTALALVPVGMACAEVGHAVFAGDLAVPVALTTTVGLVAVGTATSTAWPRRINWAGGSPEHR